MSALQPIGVGATYDRLTVIGRHGSVQNGNSTTPTYLCRCTCGTTRVIPGYKLKRGDTRSCGCLKRERAAARHLIHGHVSRGIKETPTYRTWRAMKARCQNPHDRFWHRYGGRGIRVCDAWQSFATFLGDMGLRPDRHTLDRIDNDGHYEPGNCRWADNATQARNRGKR